MGCMMNLRLAQAWRALPEIMAIGAAIGNKNAVAALRTGLTGGHGATSSTSAKEIIEQLKMREGT